jgi:hypothetical protein
MTRVPKGRHKLQPRGSSFRAKPTFSRSLSIPAPTAGCSHLARFREMWDAAGLPRKLVAGPTVPYGCPSHQRCRDEWAEKDGRSPSEAFRSGPTR